MSFEGFYQTLCENGHYKTVDWYAYEGDHGIEDASFNYTDGEIRCLCGAKIAWDNLVDDTNCDGYGLIDMKQFLVSPAKTKVCNLGHAHMVEDAVYRIPTREETLKFRSDGKF